jgi:N-methylhydantoinase B
VRAGEVIRIRTTGGGGWGEPLERDPELVVRDVVWRKVSPGAALDDYGVVLNGSLEDDSLSYDAEATKAHRQKQLAGRSETDAFFDRGPGYATLSGGKDAAEVDWL